MQTCRTTKGLAFPFLNRKLKQQFTLRLNSTCSDPKVEGDPGIDAREKVLKSDQVSISFTLHANPPNKSKIQMCQQNCVELLVVNLL